MASSEKATPLKISTSAPTMGWILLSAFGIAQICSWGSLYYSFPQIAVAMSTELGWLKSDIYGALTVGLLLSAAGSIPVGVAIDKGYGRWIMTGGSVLAGLFLMLWSQVQSLAWFYAIIAGVGFLHAATLYSAAFAVINRHFDQAKIRDNITTLTLWGGFASTVFIPLIEWLMTSMNWREVLILLGLINIFICAGIYLFLPKTDQTTDTLTTSAASTAPASSLPSEPTVSLRWILTHPVFWALFICFALYEVITTSFRFHLYPLLTENGLSGEDAVFILALLGPGQVAGRILMKIFSSKDIAHIGILIAAVFPATFIALIVFPTHFVVLALSGIAFGAAVGVMTIVRGVAIPTFLTKQAYGTINGIMNTPILVLKAFSPSVAAFSWVISGSYFGLLMGLLVASVIMLISFVSVAWMTRIATSTG